MRCTRVRLAAVVFGVMVSEALATSALAGPVNSTANPTSKIEEIEKAGVALQKGQVDEAYKLLQEAQKKNPSLPPARLMLARLFFNVRDGAQQARAILEQASQENPDHPEIFITNGVVAMGEGRITDAILNCEAALKLANAERWTKDQRQSFQTQARKGLASAHERRAEWGPARANLAAWLELAEKAEQGKIRQRLAQALFFLDKADDAALELQQAVKDDATLDPPTVTMAQFWSAKGDAKMARDWFDKAIKAEPNSVRVHLAYANWLLQQNEVPQAKVHAEEAAKIQGDSPDVLKLQGLIARITKDLAAAEKQFRRVLTDAPGDFFASNQLALVLADQSAEAQRTRAVQMAEINARQFQRNADALSTLGYVYFRTGNVDDALKSLQMAISGGQAAADTAYYLALVLDNKDKTDEAIKLLDGALQAKGLFVYRTDAQAFLEKLKKKAPAASDKDKEKKSP